MEKHIPGQCKTKKQKWRYLYQAKRDFKSKSVTRQRRSLYGDKGISSPGGDDKCTYIRTNVRAPAQIVGDLQAEVDSSALVGTPASHFQQQTETK